MGGAIDEIFGGGQKQAFEDLSRGLGRAQQPISQATAAAQKGLLPFQQAGTAALPQLQQLAGQDPASVIKALQGQFQISPGAQMQTQQGIRAANLAASAGGTVGSGAEQKQLAQFAQGISSEDLQNFLRNALGVRGQQTGILQGLAGGGQQAAMGSGQFGMKGGEDIANLISQQATAQAKGEEAGAGGLTGLLSSILGSSLGGALTGGLSSLFEGGLGELGSGLSSLFGGGGGGALAPVEDLSFRD